MTKRWLLSLACCMLGSQACLAQYPYTPPNDDNGYFVTGVYQIVLGRVPDPDGWIWHHFLLANNYLSRTGTTNDGLDSVEYANNYGSPDAGTFITELFQNAFSRAPNSNEYTYYTGLLTNGQATRADIVAYAIGSTEFQGNANGSFAAIYHTDYATPASGPVLSGPAGANRQTVAVNYTNGYGPADVFGGQIAINIDTGGLNASSSCFVLWDHSGSISLSASSGPYCALNSSSSVQATSTGYSVALDLTFPASFSGSHSVWATGTNTEGLSSPWADLGDVSVTGGFTVTAVPSLSVNCGQSASASLTITPPAGFNGTLDLSPVSSPTGFAAVFGAASLQFTGGQPSSVSLTITAAAQGCVAGTKQISVAGMVVPFVVQSCSSGPSREYVRLGSRVVAIENAICAP